MFVRRAARDIPSRQNDVGADGISLSMKCKGMIHHYVSFSFQTESSVKSLEHHHTERKVLIITVVTMFECSEKQVIDDNNGEISCF